MIIEERKKKPYLHLGFNRQEIESYIDFPITIWQDTLYNSESYNLANLDIRAGDAVVDNFNFNKIELSFPTTGIKTVFIELERDTEMQSNQLTIQINNITWGAKDIFLNNEDLTFSAI